MTDARDTRNDTDAHEADGHSRRHLLECMVWAGTGVLWTVSGGVPRSRLLGADAMAAATDKAAFSFMQISDSHIGFAKDPNTDTPGTLREAIAIIGRQKGDAGLLIHTGDVSQDWGWGTQDGEQALSYLRRFGSVTVLNGHIHQVMQKVEGNLAFHTARSTAFPQPTPGTAPSPGPIKNLPPGKLRSTLGIAKVSRVLTQSRLAIIDTPLGA